MEQTERLTVTFQERVSGDHEVIQMRVFPFRRGFALVDEHPLVEFKTGYVVSNETLAETLDSKDIDVVVEPCEILQ